MSDNNFKITKEIVEKQGLSMDEYEMIKTPGTEPNYTELGCSRRCGASIVLIRIQNRC